MTSRDFCFWLQGFFEIVGDKRNIELMPYQTNIIQDHLNLVFTHEIDPSMGDKIHQEALNKIHHDASYQSLKAAVEFGNGGVVPSSDDTVATKLSDGEVQVCNHIENLKKISSHPNWPPQRPPIERPETIRPRC